MIDGGNWTGPTGLTFISRIDLTTMTINWSMLYTTGHTENANPEIISGLTLSPDSTKLAAVSFNLDSPYYDTGRESFFFWTVRAADGMVISKEIQRVKFTDS